MLTNEKARYLLTNLKEQYGIPMTVLSRHTGVDRSQLYKWLKGDLDLGDKTLHLVETYLHERNLLNEK